MKIKNLFAAAALCFAAQGPGTLLADGGEEILLPHPMTVYPGSVQVDEDNGLNRLTKDSLAAVRKHFEANLQPGDSIKAFTEDGEAGFKVMYTKKVGSRNLTVLQVRVASRTEKRPPHQAFGELNAQVSAGRHKEPELQALLKE